MAELGPVPAGAHTDLIASTPEDGERVAAPVGEVVLVYSGEVRPVGEGFAVLDANAELRAPTTVTSDDGRMWRLGFDPPLEAGPIGLRWRVQAPDAHPISGRIQFEIAPGTVGAPSPDLTGRTGSGGPSPGPEGPGVAAADNQPPSAAAGDPAMQPDGDDPASIVAESPTEIELSRREALDDFFNGAAPAATYSAAVGHAGRTLGIIGVVIGVGSVIFAFTVLTPADRERRSVVVLAAGLGALTLAGAGLELAGEVGRATREWRDAWTAPVLEELAGSSVGTAIALRAIGAVLFVAGCVGYRVRYGGPTHRISGDGAAPAGERERLAVVEFRSLSVRPHRASAPVAVSALRSGTSEAASQPPTDSPPAAAATPAEPNPPAPSSRLPMPTLAIMAAIGTLVASYAFDGHTVTSSNRLITSGAAVTHVLAAATWAGGVVSLAVVLGLRHRRREPLGSFRLGARFSVVASLSLALAGAAGTALAVSILSSSDELWSTPWGRVLLVKFLLVTAAAALGGYNHFVVIPSLAPDRAGTATVRSLRQVVTVEAILVVAVAAITAVLVASGN